MRLKLRNCEINFFYVKNRIYVSQNEKLQISILQIIHEIFSKKHVNKTIIYNKLSRYYY